MMSAEKTKNMSIQLMINISNKMMLNVYIMYTHPHIKITDGAKMARLIDISNNIREHPLRLERL